VRSFASQAGGKRGPSKLERLRTKPKFTMKTGARKPKAEQKGVFPGLGVEGSPLGYAQEGDAENNPEAFKQLEDILADAGQTAYKSKPSTHELEETKKKKTPEDMPFMDIDVESALEGHVDENELKELVAKAQGGDVSSMESLGAMYSFGFGNGGEPNLPEAAKWLTMASEHGSGEAHSILSFLRTQHDFGDNFQKDAVAEMYNALQQEGFENAETEMLEIVGDALLKGNVVEPDEEKALELLRIAAGKNGVYACVTLARMLLHWRVEVADADSLSESQVNAREVLGEGKLVLGVDNQPDMDEGLMYLCTAAQNGMVDAAWMVHNMYAGVVHMNETARVAPSGSLKLKYLNIAVHGGHFDALVQMGDIISKNEGTHEEGLKRLREARGKREAALDAEMRQGIRVEKKPEDGEPTVHSRDTLSGYPLGTLASHKLLDEHIANSPEQMELPKATEEQADGSEQ
jgi:TPR repeat protein